MGANLDLTGDTIASTYLQLLHTGATEGVEADATGHFLTDGNGTQTTLSISTTRVGIGTEAQESALHILSSTTQEPVLIIENTNADATPPYLKFVKDSASPADDDYLGVISFIGDDDGGTATEYARIVSYSADVTNGTEDGKFAIETIVDNDSAERLVISGGNIGIGTDAPASTAGFAGPVLEVKGTGPVIVLHETDSGTPEWQIGANGDLFEIYDDSAPRLSINSTGDITIPGETDATPVLRISASGSSGAVDFPVIRFTRSKGTTGSQEIVVNDDYIGGLEFGGFVGSEGHLYTNYTIGAAIYARIDGTPSNEAGGEDIPTELAFYTSAETNAAGLSQAMTINALGYVGIGEAGPDMPLYVKGSNASNYVSTFFNAGNAYGAYGIMIVCGRTDGDTTTLTRYLEARHGGNGNIGSLDHNTSGNFVIVSTSDARLKENIKDTKIVGLDIINAVKIREFNWKAKGGIKNIAGFIAQELKEAWSPAVSGDEDGDVETDPMGVSEQSLIPPMLKAIQELSAKVTALENA